MRPRLIDQPRRNPKESDAEYQERFNIVNAINNTLITEYNRLAIRFTAVILVVALVGIIAFVAVTWG